MVQNIRRKRRRRRMFNWTREIRRKNNNFTRRTMGGVWTGRWPLPFSSATFERGDGKAKILKVHRVYRAGNDLRRSSPSDLSKDTRNLRCIGPQPRQRLAHFTFRAWHLATKRPTNGSNVVADPPLFAKFLSKYRTRLIPPFMDDMISFCREFYPF